MATEPSTLPSKCLNCQEALEFPVVCTGCQTLFPPTQTSDYFELLGLPREFTIDEQQLQAAYRAIARNIHPDRFAGQAQEVGALATKISADVNRAFAVLSDPVQRASYLLELAGGPLATEVREVCGGLLVEVMTLREQIEVAQAAGDADAISAIRESISTRREETINQLSSMAQGLSTSDDGAKKAFRQVLNSVKYYDNLLEEVAIDPLSGQTGGTDG